MKEGLEIFSVVEVNRRLGLVDRIVGDILSLSKNKSEKERRYRNFRESARTSSSSELRETIRSLRSDLAEIIDSLESLKREIVDLGGILKDPDQGFVDFFSKIEGRMVFLCWRPGDREIHFWHELDKDPDQDGMDVLNPLPPGEGSLPLDPADHQGH